jgi:hypothetical protein
MFLQKQMLGSRYNAHFVSEKVLNSFLLHPKSFFERSCSHSTLQIFPTNAAACAKDKTVNDVTRSWKNGNDKLRGLNPKANYTDRATAACRRS